MAKPSQSEVILLSNVKNVEDQFKLKTFADSSMHVSQKILHVFICEQLENTSGKVEDANYQHFLHISTRCIHKLSPVGSL